jgi:hypothetical protein
LKKAWCVAAILVLSGLAAALGPSEISQNPSVLRPKRSGFGRPGVSSLRRPAIAIGRSTSGPSPRPRPATTSPSVIWNTVFGGDYPNDGYDVAVDANGNAYVTGTSEGDWGSPIRPYAGYWDGFVAKFDSDGHLLWNTFLGYSYLDEAWSIALDGSGNIYVAGYSWGTWFDPIHPFFRDHNVFVAKLDNDGNLIWNTFLGYSGLEWAGRLAVDDGGSVFVVGLSPEIWGAPIKPPNEFGDMFAAKLDTDGNLLWTTFLGNLDTDIVNDIALGPGGSLYLVGWSSADWGSPLHHCAAVTSGNIFLAQLDSGGHLVWNTFQGDEQVDGVAVAVDVSGNAYVAGQQYGDTPWGNPLSPINEIVVAKFDSGGQLLWNTYLGGDMISDTGKIALDASGRVYVTGDIQTAEDKWDAFVTKLDENGQTLWTGFLGFDEANGAGITVGLDGSIWVTGNRVVPIPGGWSIDTKAFVAKLQQPPNQFNLMIVAGVGGTTNPAPGVYAYDPGALASIREIPAPGYRFDHWTGDVPRGQATNPNISVFMDADKSVRAVFVRQFTLTIAAGPGGTTLPAPGAYLYDEGVLVSVRADPDSGYQFDGWSGDASGSVNPLAVALTADKSIRAGFSRAVKPPLGLQAERLVNRSLALVEYVVRLTWQANPANTGITAYRIYRIDDGRPTFLAEVGSNVFTFLVRGLQANTAYQFGVTAVKDRGWESELALIKVS